MPLRRVIIGSLAIVCAMGIAGAWAWAQLPDGAEVPIHWGIDGNPDDWADKSIALFSMPALGLGLIGLFLVIPVIEPRRANLERSRTAYHSIWLVTLGVLGLVQVGIVAFALGVELDMTRLIIVGVGVMFVIIGNVMGKLRSSFLVGVRTPWTLTSERSWARTHRLTGRLFVIEGLVLIVLGLVGAGGVALVLVAGVGTLALVAVAFICSYAVWRTDPDRKPL